MCGPARPSSGQRIAVIFPSSSPSSSSYSIFFHNITDSPTKATFRIEDPATSAAFRGCNRIDLRIERHGDLTSALGTPLHTFQLNPNKSLEFELPQRLDLGVSEMGIVGRQVTISAGGVGIGTGIVGFD
ncbi:hypothetical protein ASPWEDRAFT_171813 [Aspergillus wentii DTO 134E9]|uniref:Uncharacterized protein n=1 Tax=Aspergillus wentii DTO 134E9 TaxID=1073089 RepID=A0A1L9RJA6_ASPWE|nr:uncharacterized protein ASPWEDRAFT_171813 [Aspergillus wentii DTO 134E9]KAI9932061.1 hypothetical protein MW887_009566 [Aspergillus wentii]OJJ34984.1 hypothetical protein ASPWEDRAFT_171813 [Aspergillus wentii DTO 134E9]